MKIFKTFKPQNAFKYIKDTKTKFINSKKTS